MITDTRFCEYHYSSHNYGYEPINSISSLVFCVYALYFIYVNSSISKIQYMLASSLFVCGCGSVLFHYTLDNYWRMIDEVPMLWMVIVSNMYIKSFNNKFNNLVYNIFCYSCLLISIISNIQSEQIIIFRTIFIASTLYLCYVIRLNKKTYMIASIGGISWLIDMFYCNQYIYYLYLHSIWHVCIGYFAYRTLYCFDKPRLPLHNE
jgi:hypothetical protein